MWNVDCVMWNVDCGMGIAEWGDFGEFSEIVQQSAIRNPQSAIPNPQSPIPNPQLFFQYCSLERRKRISVHFWYLFAQMLGVAGCAHCGFRAGHHLENQGIRPNFFISA